MVDLVINSNLVIIFKLHGGQITKLGTGIFIIVRDRNKMYASGSTLDQVLVQLSNRYINLNTYGLGIAVFD